jgi:hypothetical protein
MALHWLLVRNDGSGSWSLEAEGDDPGEGTRLLTAAPESEDEWRVVLRCRPEDRYVVLRELDIGGAADARYTAIPKESPASAGAAARAGASSALRPVTLEAPGVETACMSARSSPTT